MKNNKKEWLLKGTEKLRISRDIFDKHKSFPKSDFYVKYINMVIDEVEDFINNSDNGDK